MEQDYWNGVWGRLKSLGKTAIDAVVPAAVDYGITELVNKACTSIEAKLNQMFRQTIRNSAISFAINLAGVLILVFKPFGLTPSKFTAYGFFLASFLFWLYRTIRFIRNYGKQTLDVSKAVLKEKSVYRGIERYVMTEFPLISLGYAGIAIASAYVPSLKNVPRVSEFVAYLVQVFWKRVALFAGIMAVYTVTVFWIIKPVIIRMYS